MARKVRCRRRHVCIALWIGGGWGGSRHPHREARWTLPRGLARGRLAPHDIMRASFPVSFRSVAARAWTLRSGSWLLGGLLLGGLLLGACSVDSEPLFERVEPLDTNVSRPGNLPTFPAGGSGSGTTGVASEGGPGQSIVGLIGVDAGVADSGAPLAADAGGDASAACQLDVECDDGNECTLDECSAGACRSTALPAGSACGRSFRCTTERSRC